MEDLDDTLILGDRRIAVANVVDAWLPSSCQPHRAKCILGTRFTLVLKEQTMTDRPARPTIARIWRGRTTRDRADEYEKYHHEAGIKPLIEKALGVQTFREDRQSDTEFVTVSYWESVEAMSRFTGGDPTRIHHLDRDAEFLIELPDRVQILTIRTSRGDTGGGAA